MASVYLGDYAYLVEEEQWAQDVDVEEGKMHKILGLDPDQKISEYGSASAAVKKLIDAVGEKEAAGMINYAANLTDDKFLEQMQDELKKNNEAVVEAEDYDSGEQQALGAVKTAINQLRDTVEKWGADIDSENFRKMVEKLNREAAKVQTAIQDRFEEEGGL